MAVGIAVFPVVPSGGGASVVVTLLPHVSGTATLGALALPFVPAVPITAVVSVIVFVFPVVTLGRGAAVVVALLPHISLVAASQIFAGFEAGVPPFPVILVFPVSGFVLFPVPLGRFAAVPISARAGVEMGVVRRTSLRQLIVQIVVVTVGQRYQRRQHSLQQDPESQISYDSPHLSPPFLFSLMSYNIYFKKNYLMKKQWKYSCRSVYECMKLLKWWVPTRLLLLVS